MKYITLIGFVFIFVSCSSSVVSRYDICSVHDKHSYEWSKCIGVVSGGSHYDWLGYLMLSKEVIAQQLVLLFSFMFSVCAGLYTWSYFRNNTDWNGLIIFLLSVAVVFFAFALVCWVFFFIVFSFIDSSDEDELKK